jgi:ribosomal-protein-serine acetyltransferase
MVTDNTVDLRPPSLDLLDDFHDALIESYPEHRQFLAWATENPDIKTTRENMLEAQSNFEQNKTELRFIITRKPYSRVVGCIGLIIRDISIPYLEIGYWARTSDSGKGYISRSVRLVEQYAITEFNVKRLEIKMATSNQASRRVAEASGFTHEPTHKCDRMLPSGEIVGTHVFCKLYS